MARLYKHKRHGHQLKYTVFFPDSTAITRDRYFKIKTKANIALQDVERLEALSSQGRLTHEEVVFFLHMKYIKPEEAKRLTRENIPLVDPVTITWEKMKEIFIQHVQLLSKSSKKTYPGKIKPVLDYFHDKAPLDITKKDIEKFVKYRKVNKKATSTIKGDLYVLRTMFHGLLDKELISVNPAEGIKVPGKVKKKIPRILFPNELKIFFGKLEEFTDWCKGYFAEMILTYLYTGLRRIELVELLIQNINFADKVVIIPGKGDKERIIDILPPLIPVLQSVIYKNNNRNGKYFFGAYNKPIVHEDRLTHLFRYFINDIGLPVSISLHSLRHTFISYAIKASGGDLKYVQQLAGHADLKTTTRYTHLIPMRESPIAQLNYDKFIDEDNNDNEK